MSVCQIIQTTVSCPPLQDYLQACSAASLWPLLPLQGLPIYMLPLSPLVQGPVPRPRETVSFLCLV
ncbi:hypothetical protein FR483_n022R [Paramecium bursaria Chlorella virus FR483]|uniref:Uncharacterized protein n022R n=1 Tax=Paramecium bursaria Chlorella virus FR483 TaxID=399781 RepID=A7J676_PBCVF|nr:hypothetical protein FR483_n022R [Paramecium bursaria Chlorella virus FR483]ABT15307.1 hypothetical protein FR483_n022R [Paramecium bursaria Chlorella virus FR483]